jgi:hypothetical protein
MEVDREQRLHNQWRLRRLSLDPRADVTIFSGHDRREFEALRDRRPLPRAGAFADVRGRGAAAGQREATARAGLRGFPERHSPARGRAAGIAATATAT